MQAHVDEIEKSFTQYNGWNFLGIFSGPQQAATMTIMRLWRARVAYKIKKGVYELYGSGSPQTLATSGVVKQRNAVALPGYRRKHMMWVDAVHVDLRTEFDRLRRLEVKINSQTLRALDLNIINTSSGEAYHAHMMHSNSKISIFSKIACCWK